jgi:hypothetical protein
LDFPRVATTTLERTQYGTEYPEVIGITSLLYFYLCLAVSQEQGILDLFLLAEQSGVVAVGYMEQNTIS